MLFPLVLSGKKITAENEREQRFAESFTKYGY